MQRLAPTRDMLRPITTYAVATAFRRSGRPSIGAARGAPQAGEIEYLLGNLERTPTCAWTSADRAVSRIAQSYLANFLKSGEPNAPGLPS
jgi:para-nitrobenzyl esterase